MGYLSEYEQDIFVSHAHSLLNDWSKRLVEDTRKLVAIGLGLRDAREVGLWWDYKISGHQPLTRELRDRAERSAVLLVLMSEWYLESSWCSDELEWFIGAVRQKRADRPVFVVRVRATDHDVWPAVFKDERGFPLVGYDFVRATEDDALGLPKGYPTPEDAPDSTEYYDVLSKLASDIVRQLKTLSQLQPPEEGALAEMADQESSARTRSRDDDLRRSVFVMSGPHDDALALQIGKLMADSDLAVFPQSLSTRSVRDVESIVDDEGLLKVLKQCVAILLVGGDATKRICVDERIEDIIFDIQPKLNRPLPLAIVGAPHDMRLDHPDVRALSGDLATVTEGLKGWLTTLSGPAGGGLA